ncbi:MULTISPECIES: hypothetical protein [Nocardiaceae]|jgi:hypothetical protein|nr:MULTISPECIES: hypothetical protein [Rhodococcus]
MDLVLNAVLLGAVAGVLRELRLLLPLVSDRACTRQVRLAKAHRRQR